MSTLTVSNITGSPVVNASTINATSYSTNGSVVLSANSSATLLSVGVITGNSLSLTTASGSIVLNKPGVRQTVISGPVTTAGLPNFLPATSASLSLTTQNISTGTNALVIGAAQGITSLGTQDTIGYYTTNLTWSSLTGSTTNYLYINASTGATGFTTLAPIYQIGGTPSVTNGQFTFNIAEMTGYLGNGTTAPATPIVFVGQAVTGVSTVTSTVAYAYNGKYISALQNMPGASTSVSLNHNLGVSPSVYDVLWTVVCSTTQYSYPVNAELPSYGATVPGQSCNYVPCSTDYLSAAVATPPTYTSAYIPPAGGGTVAAVTAGNWRMRLYVNRRF